MLNPFAVGTQVYIKQEGDKFNPRDFYVVVGTREDKAVVQKMNKGKFNSRQYVVPMSRLFPCVGSSRLEDKEEKQLSLLILYPTMTIFSCSI